MSKDNRLQSTPTDNKRKYQKSAEVSPKMMSKVGNNSEIQNFQIRK